MSISRYQKTTTELEDQRISDILRTFIDLELREERRQRLNTYLPKVLQMVDSERAAGNSVDLHTLVKQVYFENKLPKIIE